MNISELQATLKHNGFPCGPVDGAVGPLTRAGVAKFQAAYNAGTWLTIDGTPGPLTYAAAEALPRLSAHFTVDELASRGNGNCYVDRRLLQALEGLRKLYPGPLHIISGYRDLAHNARIGGATSSMHLYGLAADVEPTTPVETVVRLGLFSGIGDRHGLVSHVDLRHLSVHNKTPMSTPARPARWTYT